MRLSESKANRWKRQLDSLKRQVPAVQRVSATGDQWIVKVVRPDYSEFFTLRIILPATFPHNAPIIQLEGPPLMHAWIDQKMVVWGHPLLNGGWLSSSDLGTLMVDILREFYLNPPKPYKESPPPTQKPVESPTYSFGEYKPVERAVNPFEILLPKDFPELRDLSSKELNRLLSDREALRLFVFDLPTVKSSLDALNISMQSNQRSLKLIREMLNSIHYLDTEAQTKIATRTQKITRLIALKEEESNLKEEYNWEKFKEIFINEAKNELAQLDELKTNLVSNEMEWPAYERQFLDKRKKYHHAMAHTEMIERISKKTQIT
ncbi:putative Vacuolar protein sorting-associated protein 37A [Cardiosporidium cionae]|uniref:Vacuolar protein sorting-associated protein 37A n=1 Tax=Cardiosporidium cionae TaxID=476202 RepID=A0ABQ7J6N5_9APIC|nr:putative Vacuolar protein sorting-associated protein 37A [Cardiosporidium cionae]|eukprot:KAF8819637.1 putative Vacuolar protein sorting-associated protein 37A [Cardiosporidium cionae]